MYIRVITHTNSKKDNIVKKEKDVFEVSVKNKPERNQANKKIIELLAVYFNKKPNKIRIVNGHHHPHKLLVVEE